MNAFDVAGLRYLQLQMLLTVESSEMRSRHRCVGSDTWYGANNSPALGAALSRVERLFPKPAPCWHCSEAGLELVRAPLAKAEGFFAARSSEGISNSPNQHWFLPLAEGDTCSAFRYEHTECFPAALWAGRTQHVLWCWLYSWVPS